MIDRRVKKTTEDDVGSALTDAGFVIVHRLEDKRKVAIEVGRESRDKVWKYRSQLNELLKPFGYAKPWFNIPTFRRRKGMWLSIYVKLEHRGLCVLLINPRPMWVSAKLKFDLGSYGNAVV